MDDAILVIDEGTSSTRAALVSGTGAIAHLERRDLDIATPSPGWVEQDAAQIWTRTLDCARLVASRSNPRAIGITNQRETIVFWDRVTGEPLAPAIVWQDRRTASACAALHSEGKEEVVRQRTGLLLDPYFSATKIGWALDHWPALHDAGDRLALGTIDSWLIFKLTGGLHVTDATNASRTMLMDLTGGWNAELCALFGVPMTALPAIVDSAGSIGETRLMGGSIPITGIVGDQQGAAIGQGCLIPGMTKATFGTGAFLLTHTGAEPRRSAHRLLSTVAWQIGGKRTYALEGSMFVAGQLVQWMRDELGLIERSDQCDVLARSVSDDGGVTIVPALAGLGAPHWNPGARGAILGVTMGTTKAHIVRAALEGIATQAAELQGAFADDGARWASLRMDGGMAASDFLAQDLADLLDVPVERPVNVESTILGAAILASVGAGHHPTLEAALKATEPQRMTFAPAMTREVAAARMERWRRAIGAVVGYAG
jgi:glycerol kinase